MARPADLMGMERIYHKPLPPRARMFEHLARNLGAAIVIVGLSLAAGATGYRTFEGMTWIDAFYGAAMILTGMGPSAELHHDSAKVFAIFYALFAAIVFIVSVTLILAPVVQRFLHRFHLNIHS